MVIKGKKMKVNQKNMNIKLILFIFAIVSIIMVFIVNRMMISQLRYEVRQQVEYLAKSYSEAINSDNEEDIHFVMDILLPSLNFPIIITENGVADHRDCIRKEFIQKYIYATGKSIEDGYYVIGYFYWSLKCPRKITKISHFF